MKRNTEPVVLHALGLNATPTITLVAPRGDWSSAWDTRGSHQKAALPPVNAVIRAEERQPMKARALIASASFDPTQLKVIGDAFDKAWTQVAPSITSSPVTLEAARLKLANVVLQIAKGGLIEIDWLAQEALRITFGTRTD